VGHGLGGLAGGYVYERYGARRLYQVTFAVMSCGWAACSLAQLALAAECGRRRGGRYAPVAAAEEEEGLRRGGVRQGAPGWEDCPGDHV
jgi:hypothetical protein